MKISCQVFFLSVCSLIIFGQGCGQRYTSTIDEAPRALPAAALEESPIGSTGTILCLQKVTDPIFGKEIIDEVTFTRSDDAASVNLTVEKDGVVRRNELRIDAFGGMVMLISEFSLENDHDQMMEGSFKVARYSYISKQKEIGNVVVKLRIDLKSGNGEISSIETSYGLRADEVLVSELLECRYL